MVVDFKELTQAFVELGKSRSCRGSQQAGGVGQSGSPSPKAVCWQDPRFLGSLRLFRKALNRVNEAHPHMEGSLLYSQPTDLNVNPIPKNTFTERPRIVFDQISGNRGQAKLTQN